MTVMTKSQQIGKILRDAIMRGRWAVGERMPSEEELLAELGVSRTTLRDALNALANEGLITRKHGSGTYVAKDIKTAIIALVSTAEALSSPQGFFHRHMFKEAGRLAHDAGYRSVLSVGNGLTFEELKSSMLLFEKSTLKDTVGVISSTTLGPLEDELRQENVPVVYLGHIIPDGRYNVIIDINASADMAVQMLKSHGYHDFALMRTDYSRSGLPGIKLEWQMHEDMRRMHLDAVDGDESRLISVEWTPSFDNAYDAFKEWWAKPDHPNSIFFFDDALCDVSLRAIHELGIDVPGELAIISIGNIERQYRFSIPLTCIGIDPVEVASAAWQMLHKLISDQYVNEPTVCIKPRIIEGKSLG